MYRNNDLEFKMKRILIVLVTVSRRYLETGHWNLSGVLLVTAPVIRRNVFSNNNNNNNNAYFPITGNGGNRGKVTGKLLSCIFVTVSKSIRKDVTVSAT